MGRLRQVLDSVLGGRRLATKDPSVSVSELEAIIGYRFDDPELLIRSLKHRSYVYAEQGQEPTNGADANERLEFLGDAVLGLIVTEHLYRRFPSQREGALTKRKSILVSKTILAKRAKSLGLDQYVLLSKLEDTAGGRQRRSILGDCYEALLGAIYLDGGLEPVTTFLERELLTDLESFTGSATNHKTVLLEWVQAKGLPHPKYELRDEQGPDHHKTFDIGVTVDGEQLGSGSGRSKKEAQQKAAQVALGVLALRPDDELSEQPQNPPI